MQVQFEISGTKSFSSSNYRIYWFILRSLWTLLLKEKQKRMYMFFFTSAQEAYFFFQTLFYIRDPFGSLVKSLYSLLEYFKIHKTKYVRLQSKWHVILYFICVCVTVELGLYYAILCGDVMSQHRLGSLCLWKCSSYQCTWPCCWSVQKLLTCPISTLGQVILS